MIAIAVPVGLIIGLVMGTLGGGGAVLTVPILVFGFGLLPHDATSASLIIVGVGAIAGVLAHQRRGTVRWRDGLIFGALGVPAAAGGSWAAAAIDPNLLLGAFAVLLVVVAVLMLRQSQRPRLDVDGTPRHPAIIAATALGIGLLTGFFGVGGGFAMVPALVLIMGFRMPAAVGTSLLVILINSTSALTTRVIAGLDALDWWLIGSFAAAAVAGNLLGGQLSARISSASLQRAFGILLMLVAVYTGVRAALALA